MRACALRNIEKLDLPHHNTQPRFTPDKKQLDRKNWEYKTAMYRSISVSGRWRTETVLCLSWDFCSFTMPNYGEGVALLEQLPVGVDIQQAEHKG